MAEVPRHRHRLGVVPGLASTTTNTPIDFPLDDGNKQLVPLGSPPVLPEIRKSHFSKYDASNYDSRSAGGGNEQTFISTSQVNNVTSRLSAVEEANKALLEEIYRLQSYVRTIQHEKKGSQQNEKKLHHDVMGAIRGSNDVISELTSRLRTMEEKLHVEKENRKTLSSLSKRLEQSIISSQQEVHSHEDKHNSKVNELRSRLEEVSRQLQRSERTSQGIVEEFHQLKAKYEMQSLEFTHMQSEVRQRTKRQEDETKEALLQARFQKDSNSLSEQNLLQMRQFFESRLAELRDSVSDVRGRITQSEAENRSNEQQANMKISELQTQLNEQLRQRQEELQSLHRSRQEQDHSEESERNKLGIKIQAVVEEMSEKLLQKEVRLREEALRKFVDLERQLQTTQAQRMDYEKQMRDDNDKRWNMQQTVLQEEMQAMKEIHRSERNKHISTTRKIEDSMHTIEKSMTGNKKALEKVLIAEITKRESQSKNVNTQIDSIQEQLKVALSSLQQAIGGLQFQVSRDKEQFMSEVKEKLTDEVQRINRGLTDFDSRMTAISVRITQQEDSLESRLAQVSTELRTEQREALHNTDEWRENLTKDLSSIHESLQDFPQEVKEMQERFNSLKEDLETRTQLESDARMKEAEGTGFKVRGLAARMESVEVSGKDDHKRINSVEQNITTMQTTAGQMERLVSDVRSNMNVRLNSETKMRLEEMAALKREMARLRLDVQPLLWKQAVTSRKFIKKESNVLNEWGIYQCARWHDIKMRWLRLLSRSKRRNRIRRQNAENRNPSDDDVDQYADINLHSGSQHDIPNLSAAHTPVNSPQHGQQQHSNPQTPVAQEQEWYNQENAGLPIHHGDIIPDEHGTPPDSRHQQGTPSSQGRDLNEKQNPTPVPQPSAGDPQVGRRVSPTKTPPGHVTPTTKPNSRTSKRASPKPASAGGGSLGGTRELI